MIVFNDFVLSDHNANVLIDFIFEKHNRTSINLSGDKKWHYKLGIMYLQIYLF